MSLRDMVTGGANCSAPGERRSSSANPLGALADSLLGSAAKTQDRIRELPSLAGPGSSSSANVFGPIDAPHMAAHQLPFPGAELPGMEAAAMRPYDPKAQEFLDSFHHGGMQHLDAAWEEAHHHQQQHHQHHPLHHAPHLGPPEAQFDEFEQIFSGLSLQGPQGASSSSTPLPPEAAATPPALRAALHSFFDASRGGVPFQPPMHLAHMPVSQEDAARIRNRTSILARQVFAEQGEGFADAQVSMLLQSLGVDASGLPGPQAHMGGRLADFEGAWGQAAQAQLLQPQSFHHADVAAADQWAAEFAHMHPAGPVHGQPWEQESARMQGEGQAISGKKSSYLSLEDAAASAAADVSSTGWADEYAEDMVSRHGTLNPDANPAGPSARSVAAQQQTQRLMDTLSQDPKMQNSKFLQFVSRMSRGEIVVEDGKVKETGASSAAEGREGEGWAEEFEALHHTMRLHEGDVAGSDWANEFATAHPGAVLDGPQNDWADEFGQNMADGMFGSNAEAQVWANEYDSYVQEQLQDEQQRRATSASSRFLYQFADNNPYVGHPQPFEQGTDLFRRGLLSEAILALEAAVLRDDSNSEAWRMLGVAHAENDDDKQAIAAMTRARDADPSNLDALLSLGVSHTNELEQAEALFHLRSWLQHHPQYSKMVPPNATNSLTHTDVLSLFTEAARTAPEDADLQVVLGVLFNLSHDYDRAKGAFQRALSLRPADYSLWNKLGATQANSAESAAAILAYQKALDLKPNYVRAWTNMGISYANQGKYDESLRYYVRAVAMNPAAENAWQYLRIALSCAGRSDALSMCDGHDVDALQREFPL